MGLGGCMQYSGGPHQYTEKQMAKRVRRLGKKLKKAGGVDIILTHAPVSGFGDGEDRCHRGFEVFGELIEKYSPGYLVHGHVHMNYGRDVKRVHELGGTKIVNASGRYAIEIDDVPYEKEYAYPLDGIAGFFEKRRREKRQPY